MKIDRLIGILSILLQRGKVTAPFLAERFEVSRRTVSRDIDALGRAGIPIVTEPGAGGGISLMEGYTIDKTLLTSRDMQAVLAGLRSLDSVSGTNRYRCLMEKISMGDDSVLSTNDHIRIDLSSAHKTALVPKIELIQSAIDRKERVSFFYFAPKGESRRVVEPGVLIFQWSSWYVWGYCCERRACRLFKLNRMLDLRCTGESCQEEGIPPYRRAETWGDETPVQAQVLLEPEAKWRLIEEFDVEAFREREDRKLLLSACFSDKDSLFCWLLGMGRQAVLLEPESLKLEFCHVLEEMRANYPTIQT